MDTESRDSRLRLPGKPGRRVDLSRQNIGSSTDQTRLWRATRASATALNTSTVSRGRALPAIVFRYYAAGSSAQVMYDINHLQKLTLKGDNLESFHNTWTMVFSELSKPPDPELRLILHFRQVQYFKPLAEDVAHYTRARFLHSPDHSFDYLWGAASRFLLTKGEDHLQESLSRGIKGSTDRAAPGVTGERGGSSSNGSEGSPRAPTPAK